jgi:hypothetical protein
MSLTNCRIAGFPAGRPGFDKFFDKSPFDKIGDDLETQKPLNTRCFSYLPSVGELTFSALEMPSKSSVILLSELAISAQCEYNVTR